ncbi:MAG: hypothetical protein WCW52_02810 [Elusimicrobiales bacterium]|jgi:quercetin dioxygenase-like cupin family protein
MKLFQIAILTVAVSFGAGAFAKPPSRPAGDLKITGVTGTVNIVKNGAVVMTIKAGDALPAVKDGSMSFVVVDGSLELQYGGGTITAGLGASFTITDNKGRVSITLGSSAPVSIKTKFGQNVLLTANSQAAIITKNNKVEVKVVKGHVVTSNASGGDTRDLKAGETVFLRAPVTHRDAPGLSDKHDHDEPTPSDPSQTTVHPTRTLEEGEEVSGSNP